MIRHFSVQLAKLLEHAIPSKIGGWVKVRISAWVGLGFIYRGARAASEMTVILPEVNKITRGRATGEVGARANGDHRVRLNVGYIMVDLTLALALPLPQAQAQAEAQAQAQAQAQTQAQDQGLPQAQGLLQALALALAQDRRQPSILWYTGASYLAGTPANTKKMVLPFVLKISNATSCDDGAQN